MFKHTRHYRPLSVDMAAMCDVAFLLLTFFILTTRPMPLSPIHIKDVSAYATNSEPIDFAAMIMMGEGKVMFSIPEEIRKQTLVNIIKAYGVRLSDSEMEKFKQVDIIGVPVDSLKNYINNCYNEKRFYIQKGIPINMPDNQLAQWIHFARKAGITERSWTLHFMIKADKEIKYPEIKRIIDMLRKQGINKFSMYTEQEYHHGDE